MTSSGKFLWDPEDIVIERHEKMPSNKSTTVDVHTTNSNSDTMSRAENITRMTYEIALGYTWGHPNSLIEKTEENRAKWERMEHQPKIADERGWVIEIPFDV